MREFGITLSVSRLALINVTRQWERSLILGSSNYRKNVDEDFFIPSWGHHASNLRSGDRAKAERTQSEGRANPRDANSRPFSIAKIMQNNDITNFFRKKVVIRASFKKKRLSFVTCEVSYLGQISPRLWRKSRNLGEKKDGSSLI